MLNLFLKFWDLMDDAVSKTKYTEIAAYIILKLLFLLQFLN